MNALNPALPVSVREIIRVVAADFGMSERMIYGSGRTAEAAVARQLVCWIACDVVGIASAHVAQSILRDSSSVRHAARVIDAKRAEDAELRGRSDVLADRVARAGYTAMAAMLADPDPVATAERVARNPLHEAMRVSTLEIAAMALRLIELEDTAAATFQLFARHRDALTPSGDAAREHAAGADELITAVADALAALGYDTDQQEAEDRKE